MFDSVESRNSRWRVFWPEIDGLDGSRDVSRQGMWAALVVAGVTALVAAFGAMGLNSWSFVDVALFLLVALGIYKVSRFAAVAGLCLFISERVALFALTGRTGGILGIFVLFALVNGVRGAFAYRRLLKAEAGKAAEVR